jgi:hypothetical protein
MKVILSRKGFDSSAGGHPSPILPNGLMLSLPIPSSRDSLRYEEIEAPDRRSYADVLSDLGGRARISNKGAHLDPDLVQASRPRRKGWLPSLGQIGSAAGHLRNQLVGLGDLFMFYGWFRPTEQTNGRLRFTSQSDGFHAIFGYLQVGSVIRTAKGDHLPNWLLEHPHALEHRVNRRTNAIYVAVPHLSWDKSLPGAGTFRFKSNLVLSKPGMSRSCWQLDRKIFGNANISYHTKDAWRDDYFKSYPRAQEYVVSPTKAVESWAKSLVSNV